MNGALDSLDHSRGADSQQHEKTAAPVGSTTRLRRGSRATAPIVGILGIISFEGNETKRMHNDATNAIGRVEDIGGLSHARRRWQMADGRWQMQACGVVVPKRQEAGTLSL